MRKCLALLVLGALAGGTAQARLGDTYHELKERLGKVANEPAKNTTVWYVETRGGTLSYTVTFDAKGRSIAETLKPVQLADFTVQDAEGFINLQIQPYLHSKTIHQLRPGDRYSFGGRDFVCSQDQFVIIDDANDLLVVWTRSGVPSVMAVRREMLQ